MTGTTPTPYPQRPHRLVFLYLFRDFDKGTFDAGIEFTTLTGPARGRILCKSITANPKGLRSDSFLVDVKSRHILNLPGRYIVYWTSGKIGPENIYNRTYWTRDGRSYSHHSVEAKSELAYDDDGLEKSADNMVYRPRRYHERFLRLLRF